MKINVIAAVGMYIPDKGYPIGKDGKIPWDNKADMKWFRETTINHSVIMGLNTWKSLGKPLKDRLNIVIDPNCKNDDKPFGEEPCTYVTSFEEGVNLANSVYDKWGDLFVIGGGYLYKYVVDNKLADNLYIDYLAESVPDADTFFPEIYADDYEVEGLSIVLEPRKAYAAIYSKKKNIINNVDSQYLNLVKEIIKEGEIKDTRSGKVRSLFSKQLRFNLKEGLPILTTKKVYTKGIIHELLWFLKGDTNIKYLVDNNVHIWDDDAYRYYLEVVKKHNNIRPLGTRMEWEAYKRHSITPVSKEEFMEKVKAGEKMWVIVNEKAYIMSYTPNNWEYEYQYGDLNRVYGAQWTNWGGHNQIKEVIDTLKTNPDDRRMIISAWNVAEIPDMALPPCHYTCQFYTKKMTLEERQKWVYEKRGKDVSENLELLDEWNVPTRKLSCMWNQRSVDTICGLPFNITSYAILTYMIAQCVNMDVDELIFNGGDVHIYENHIDIFNKEQAKNNVKKYNLPTLKLNQDIEDIFNFKYEDITIENYDSYPAIKYPLSVGL